MKFYLSKIPFLVKHIGLGLRIKSVFILIILFNSSLLNAQNCIEIETILVNACDDQFGGSPEGLNEMFRFRVGTNPINISDILIADGWPSDAVNALPFNGFVQNTLTSSKTAELNTTILNSCGFLIEPPLGIIPAGKRVLAITSFEVSAALNSFANLTDTLFVIYHEHTGETGGHFLNFNATATPQQQTLRIQVNGSFPCYEEVSYIRADLVDASGNNADQNGAYANYTNDGIPSYGNTGCQAPFEPFSAEWTSPGGFCETAAPIDLCNLVTGTQGGTWSGSGINGSVFNPSGLSGAIEITYTVVPTNSCASVPASEMQIINVSSAVNAEISNPGDLCSSLETFNLDQLITGTSGGSWSGTGIVGNTLNISSLSGPITINYSVASGLCNDSQSETITIINLPQPQILGDTLYCNGEVVNSLSVNSEIGAQLSWYSDEALSQLISSSSSLNPTQDLNASYYVVQTNGNCSSLFDFVSIEFSVVSLPQGDTLLRYCEDESIPLASVIGTASYSWFDSPVGGVLLGSGNSYQTSAINDFLYVFATEGNCVSDALEIEIRQDTLLDANITSLSGTSLCDQGSIELISSGLDQNLWSNGSQSSSIIVSVAGSYSLTRTGLCNTASDQIDITGLPVTANFTCDVDSGYTTLPVFVSDQSINGEVYAWYLNDSLINFTAPGTITFPDSGTYVLELVLTNSSGCSDVDSSIIRVLSDKLILEIPNVFTPNGDGVNELFQVKYNAVKSFQANVFNRWGRLIYTWNSVSDGWDGKSNNDVMPNGTYYYVISGTDIKDQVFQEKGSLTLMGN